MIAELDYAFQAVALCPTPQRYTVLEFPGESSVHATAVEIFRAVNRNDRRASRATVYNNLRSLGGSEVNNYEVVFHGACVRCRDPRRKQGGK